MSFSGALTLTDLNDFITPSQACIKPVEEVQPLQRVHDPGSAVVSQQFSVQSPCRTHIAADLTRLKYKSIQLVDITKSLAMVPKRGPNFKPQILA